MFALINQGQLYTDSAGYPVIIIRCINNTVLYRRIDGRTQSVKINDFNELFERIDHQEYRQILWICPYISRHLLSLNPLLACCRRYSRGER